MDSVPARLGDSDRRLAPQEVEAVLGRAIELHVHETARGSGEEISEAELVRIGRDLGLPPEHLRQALAEVDGGLRTETDWLARAFGQPSTGSSRVVDRSAREVQRELEAYLLDVECMVVERRFQGRTVYAPASGVLASARRATRRLGGRHPLLRADRLEVAVQALDERSCCAAVTSDLTRRRRELVASGTVGGGVGGGAAAVLAGVFVTLPAALVGLPLAAAAFLGSRAAYRAAHAESSSRIESLLDRLEHGELERGQALRAMLGL